MGGRPASPAIVDVLFELGMDEYHCEGNLAWSRIHISWCRFHKIHERFLGAGKRIACWISTAHGCCSYVHDRLLPLLASSIPGFPGYSANPVEACSSVSGAAFGQIIFFMAWAEFQLNKGKFTMMDMFEDGRAPGDLGFDPLKFGENAATRERLEMAELKNGRLAMLAFSGMLHQVFVTGKPVFASLGDIFAAP